MVQSDNPENTIKPVKEDKQVVDYIFLIFAVYNTALIILISVISLPSSFLYIIPFPITLLICTAVLYGVITKRTGVFYVKYGAMVLVLLGLLVVLMMLNRWHIVVILIFALLDIGFLFWFFFYYAFTQSHLSKLISGRTLFRHEYQHDKDE